MASHPTTEITRKLVLRFLEQHQQDPSLLPSRFLAAHPEAPPGLAARLQEALAWPRSEVEARLAAPGPDVTRAEPRTVGESDPVDATLEQPGAEGSDATIQDAAGGAERTIAEPGAPEAAAPLVIDGRYEVVRTLGEGGFGRVYLVRDRNFAGEMRALKLILPQHAQRPEFAERFRNEIRIERAMSHRYIPRIHNDGFAEASYYYTMDFVDGAPLTYVLRREAPLRPDRIIRLVQQIVEALDYAHTKGIIHRDLKPGNILIVKAGQPDEEVRILDFGIAKIMHPSGDLQGAESMNTIGGIGTPHYMSPEQVRGKDVDERSDIYALGIIVYQMCSGLLPFSGQTDLEVATARLEQDPTPIPGDKTPIWLRGLVMQLLEREKQKRPTTKEVHERLEQLSAGQYGMRRSQKWMAAGLAAVGLGVAWLVLKPAGAITPKPNGGEVFAGGGTVDIEDLQDEMRVRQGLVFRGKATGLKAVQVNDQLAQVDASGTFEVSLTLPENQVSPIEVRDPDRPESPLRSIRVYCDALAPKIECIPERKYVAKSSLLLTGSVRDDPGGAIASAELLLDDRPLGPLALAEDGGFTKEVSLPTEGAHRVLIQALDRVGNPASCTLNLVLDTIPPEIRADAPPKTTEEAQISLAGKVSDVSAATLVLAQGAQTESIPLDAQGGFTLHLLTDAIGEHDWVLSAEDEAGNRSAETRLSIRRVRAPIRVEEIEPSEGRSYPAGTANVTIRCRTNVPATRVTIADREALQLPEDPRTFTLELPLKPGPNAFTVVSYDEDKGPSPPRVLNLTRQLPKLPQGLEAAASASFDSKDRPLLARHTKSGIELVLVSGGPTGDLYVGRYETTRTEYAAGARDRTAQVDVSFAQAADFCARNGLRLLSDAEWRYAGQGSGASAFPWGNEWAQGKCRSRASTPTPIEAGPVDEFPEDKSWSGVCGLAGNVSEWCSAADDRTRPVVCGGSWSSSEDNCKLGAQKNAPPKGTGTNYIGFRVCVEVL